MNSSFPPAFSLVASLIDGFDEKWGLWRLGRPGHTRPVAHLADAHSGVLTAARLMRAAQLGVLDSLPVSRILWALKELQCTDGSRLHGCFKWHAEEPSPVDTNAAFFTGLNLVLLADRYEAAFSDADRETLCVMLSDLFVWFDRVSQSDDAHYPNKFLGDLVCAWLLRERLDLVGEAGRLIGIMDRAADYWLEKHWGWGEHLSDVYTAVMLNELSALLLFARQLPEVLRQKYQRLFSALLDIEDAYGGGVRVPVIRTYAFGERPGLRSFRSTVGSWIEQPALAGRVGAVEHFNFGHLFHEKGWLDLAGPEGPVREHIEIDCFGGSKAKAWVTPAMRLGTLSRFPIMPRTDHATWGLSWQTMPVAFATGKEGWGFLRWHTREGGVDRYHPAKDKRSAYLNNALTDVVSPPIVGLTEALQDGAHACVLRRMPALSRSWDFLSDQCVLTGSGIVVVREKTAADACRLLLEIDGVPLTVIFFPLGAGVRPRLRRDGGELVWEATWPAELLKKRERIAGVWMIVCGKETPCPPAPVESSGGSEIGRGVHLEGDKAWLLSWPVAKGPVGVILDPLDMTPLRRSDLT